MKTLISMAAAALATFGLVSPAAAAWEFAPANTAFTASGRVNISLGPISVPCWVSLKGTTAGGGSITKASFRGGLCDLAQGMGLPWSMTTHTATGATFHGVAVGNRLGTCGPGNVTATLNSSGTITFAGTAPKNPLAPCALNGSVSTYPTLSIVKTHK